MEGPGSNQLRTHRLFKQVFELESYLSNVQTTALRVALTRLRVGSHSLAIEVGRYHRPSPLPVDECHCSCCQTIEDELHFLYICPKYSDLREDLESAVLQYCPGYAVLSTDQKFLSLLQSSHPQVNNSVALYVHKSFKYRLND